MFSKSAKRAEVNNLLSALSVLRTNVMVADANLNIIYINPSVIVLMREAEADLKKELPQFDVNRLIGSNIDIFHKNPEHQRKMLTALHKQHTTTVRVGSRAYDLVVTPLFAKQQRTGYVVEWSDAKERLQNLDYQARYSAVDRSQAMIEFTIDGVIVDANPNFLKTMGYTLEEIRGQHHRMFVDPTYASSQEYSELWNTLRQGQYLANQYKRFGKNGKVVWIEAAYNPIPDADGKIVKVVKFATDITEQMRMLADLKTLIDKNFGEIEGAVGRSSQQAGLAAQAVQTTTGTIQTMAASAEELAASVRQIAHMMAESKSATEAAHQQTTLADNATQRLTQASDAMGTIVAMIRDIAGQINLLALNATIEVGARG